MESSIDTYKYYVGCDLGEVQDYSAVSVIERNIVPHIERGVNISEYSIKELIQFPIRTPYPEIAKQVKLIFENPYISTYGELIVDQTGVGRPVIEMMKQEGLSPLGITITGGHETTKTVDGYNVPKKNIMTAFLIMAQSGQIKIAGELPLSKRFVKEMEAFKVKINTRTGHEIYEGEGEHDDLVLCVALPLWYAHKYDEQVQTMDKLVANYDVDERNQEQYDYLRGKLV